MENTLVYPAIYRHFKNKYYATMGIAECKDIDITELEGDTMKAWHTETGDMLVIKKHKEGNFIVCNKIKEYKNKRFVLYKSLYDDTGIYAREVDMFLSEVDKEKYPEAKQFFRFELFRYWS